MSKKSADLLLARTQKNNADYKAAMKAYQVNEEANRLAFYVACEAKDKALSDMKDVEAAKILCTERRAAWQAAKRPAMPVIRIRAIEENADAIEAALSLYQSGRGQNHTNANGVMGDAEIAQR